MNSITCDTTVTELDDLYTVFTFDHNLLAGAYLISCLPQYYTVECEVSSFPSRTRGKRSYEHD